MMNTNHKCPGYRDHFVDGIVKGADWYELSGGMQDYNYVFADCMEVTLEISCCKYPKEDRLSTYWQLNREPLIIFMEQVSSLILSFLFEGNRWKFNGECI